ncbi:hypothetical protein Tco_0942608 [Tanacetum coccineum]
MSDSEDSTVTYMAVSSPFKNGSDIGSPGVDGPPIMPEDPYAYIMAAYQVPPSPDYIPGPEEPHRGAATTCCCLTHCHAATSPTAESPGYIPESDPEEDLEEDPADYPADRDDDDNDDNEDEDEDEEEEEEHPALADSVPPIHRITTKISIRDEPSISLPPREEVERLLALTTPPPSPLTPLSSPLPHIPSPPFLASPPASPIRPLGYRAAMIRLRAETPSTSHPLPLPTSSPPLQLLSSDHCTDMPEITLPPQKRLGIDLGPRYEIGDSSAAAATRPIIGRRADYGFVDPREAVEEGEPMTLEGVNVRVTELTAVQEQDIQDIYAYHYETARLLDQEALVSREAWGRSIEVSYMTRSEILALRSVVMGQQAVISQLQAADRKSQVVTLEMLQADYQRQVQLAEALKLLKGLQTQMVECQRQHRPTKGLTQPDAPGEAGSSS